VEEFLNSFADKAAAHKLIDELPDTASMLMLIRYDDLEDSVTERFSFRNIGKQTIAQSFYAVHVYLNWILNGVW
jgi:hypothetical protein